MTPPLFELPPLHPVSAFNARRLSAIEYYQASSGMSDKTLDQPRDVMFTLEGDGEFDVVQWQQALNKAAQANFAVNLRLSGKRRKAEWIAGGIAPRLRIVKKSTWDGKSNIGGEFIRETKLPLETGPSVEVILVYAKRRYVILRASHAVMDGLGAVHFLREVFRALRGDVLRGTNATFSDVDVLRSVSSSQPPKLNTHGHIAHVTGGAQGEQLGDVWGRISLKGPQSKLLPRTVIALAQYTYRNKSFNRGHRKSNAPFTVRMAIPISLRRYVPGLLSTMNFSTMVHFDLSNTDTVDDFQRCLRSIMDKQQDAHYFKGMDLIRYLPLGLLDRCVSRTHKNYQQLKIFETAVISNLGRYNSEDFSGGGFVSEHFFAIPNNTTTFGFLFSLDNNIDLCFGMAEVYASNGRLQHLLEYLQDTLSE